MSNQDKLKVGKVMVKFWNVLEGEYTNGYFYISHTNKVFESVGTDYYGDEVVVRRATIEPHFYVDGCRVG